MTDWSFFLKLCYSTFYCATDDNIFSSTSFALSTFTLLPSLIPVAMLLKRQLSLNGFRDSRNSNSSHASAISFPALPWSSLCTAQCSRVLYCTAVSCCIALFTSAQTGCDIIQTRRWVSATPRPLTKPALVFLLYNKFRGSPAHNRSDLHTTWSPCWKCLETSGWVSRSL